MYMVSHDDITVEFIMSKRVLSVANGFDNHPSDLRLAKIQRPSARVIEHAIHSQKSLTGRSARWKATACRQATMQAPSEENVRPKG